MEESTICYMCGKKTLLDGAYYVCPSCGHTQNDYSANEVLNTELSKASNELIAKNFLGSLEVYTEIARKMPGNTDAQWGILMSNYGVSYERNDGMNHGVVCNVRNEKSFFQENAFQKIKSVVFDKKLLLYYFERSSYIETARIIKWNEKEISMVKVILFGIFCVIYIFLLGIIAAASFSYLLR